MKALVTEFHALDITQLNRGWLHPNTTFDWVWRTNKGAQIATVKITVLESAVELWFPIESTRAIQPVSLIYSAGPQGGKRPWFACPQCERRVGILYHVPSRPFFCRRCCDLAYPSQYQARNRSYGRRFRGITQRERERLSVSRPPDCQ
ncbi:MAG: hypothetical protein CV081_05280 [Nitrospira sp. LK265]|nr:hypothetical protein [Nitrospira sp.]NGZ59898.1 hypothetical protein [Nitrospira sp. LK265]